MADARRPNEKGQYDICKPEILLSAITADKPSSTPLRPLNIWWIGLILALGTPCLLRPGGRLAYFYSTTSPLTLFASSSQLAQAQADVQRYDNLIKENGRSGLWVTREVREQYDKAKQRQL